MSPTTLTANLAQLAPRLTLAPMSFVDSDGDGIPDYKAVLFGLNPLNSWDTNGLTMAWELNYFSHTGVDPNADPDGDGMSNLQEFIAGTNPRDSNSFLRFVSIARQTNANVDITWASVPGKKYQVLATTNLVGSAFQPISGTNTATGTTASFTNTNATSATKYYRVQVLP